MARAVAVALAAMSVTGCKPKTNAYAPPPPAEVTVAHAIQKQVTNYLEYTGTIEPFQTVDLRARVQGFLDQVLFKPGSKVGKGDLLFVIDKRTYTAIVDRLEAQVAANVAAFTGAESDARIAEELAVQRAGSEIDKITKVARRESARAAVLAAKAELEQARLDLEFCEVRAPLDGRITKNLVDVGNLVGTPGLPTLLATLVCSRPVYVTVDVSESDLLSVRRQRMAKDIHLEPGQIAPGEWRPVDLAIAAGTDFAIHGRVDYVDPALNPQTGTIRVRCRFDNEDEFLLPGLFVRVRFPMATEPAILAPDIALLSDQAGRYALVVDERDVVQVRHVKIGELEGTLRIVSEGLTPAERIVVNGLQRARPGATVHATLQAGAVQPADGTGVSTRRDK